MTIHAPTERGTAWRHPCDRGFNGRYDYEETVDDCRRRRRCAVGRCRRRCRRPDGQDRRFRREIGRCPLVRHQHRSRNARRRQGDQRGGRGEACRRLDGADGSLVRRRPLQRRGRHFGDPPDRLERRRGRRGPDLLECRRTALRHPPGEGRRRGRQRAAVPDLHRHRDQGRAGEDFGMGVPQRPERKPDVPDPVRVAGLRASGCQVRLWRCRGGLRPLALHLVQGDEDALGRGRL